MFSYSILKQTSEYCDIDSLINLEKIFRVKFNRRQIKNEVKRCNWTTKCDTICLHYKLLDTIMYIEIKDHKNFFNTLFNLFNVFKSRSDMTSYSLSLWDDIIDRELLEYTEYLCDDNNWNELVIRLN